MRPADARFCLAYTRQRRAAKALTSALHDHAAAWAFDWDTAATRREVRAAVRVLRRARATAEAAWRETDACNGEVA